MADIIRLLPDSVANQIAAGEVIQRPASVVKELLENSIDAGASTITLNIKDGGKTLIQVIDNGCGMSAADARMCFERHATSKIKDADDLFQIRTKGFRGEAMASIAAIAHVELKTRTAEDELGVKVVVEGSEIKEEEPVTTAAGTSISVKNLFYNVPARRNFLKSQPVETKHIIEEFQRVALAHPDIAMELHHNGSEVMKLVPGSFKQRIVGVFGQKHNQRLVPVEEETNILKVTGFIVKPEFSKKTRGEQYFFANDRFIKSPYLNHAVAGGFEELISKDHFPGYFLKLDVDTKFIDINIHPTKTEVKFEDERSIYAILNSSVKQALGKYNISPTLDFDQETTFRTTPRDESKPLLPPDPKVDPNFNPFKEGATSGASAFKKPKVDGWEEAYKGMQDFEVQTAPSEADQTKLSETWEEEEAHISRPIFQVHNRYIVTTIKSGVVVIDQQRAHERIMYEELMQHEGDNKAGSQQLMFPEKIELSATDAVLVEDIKDDLISLGFDIAEFGQNTIVLNGMPATGTDHNATALLESMLEEMKNNAAPSGTGDEVCRALARALSIKRGRRLEQEEMNNLIDQLFACNEPQTTPSGLPIIVTFRLDELEKRFER